MFEKLEFINVNFSYKGRKIINNLNFEIKNGEKISIVGSSGEGKSTLIKLILRYINPDSGHILVNGKPLNSIENWYEIVGVLSQRTHIFNRSIRDNLLIAKHDATDKELYNALEFAGLSDFLKIRTLDTILGEEARNISGGERARISLARLILRNPEFVILDEPLEGVDKLVEKEVINNIKVFVEDKTLILISHRFSILSLTDEFAVLENGELKEKGKFSEHSDKSLLKKFFKAEQELTEKFRGDEKK
ncbi:ABC-type transport system involved in cytochrome bd biosynthesis fused ATPase/permease subunit [Thermosipho japonicus]|uniref:ABC-type transport system involved in cytochrome bd biosynthesis fused ATPase/permease subunit n=1 Tax=Thermosipho japonicus TaxID=90323 RepID=A0A841GDH0_9BACT|nr:ATP-binding cassette domain-containing protein [Thermosipho japonicus]MBB6061582.1 ABC-type transport system involved in cytochrome bd biosynthesis fused ATPase/permease subunit [Thermosipho japonicus]